MPQSSDYSIQLMEHIRRHYPGQQGVRWATDLLLQYRSAFKWIHEENTAEIADGWFPLYYSPYRQDVYADQLAGAKDDFEVAAISLFNVTEDDKPETIENALAGTRAMLAFYIGGMGAKGQNYHTKLAARMGLGEAAVEIQDLFFDGKRDEAVMKVPLEFADEISLVGTPARIADRLAAWKESAVTEIMVHAGSVEQLRQAAELILPA